MKKMVPIIILSLLLMSCSNPELQREEQINTSDQDVSGALEDSSISADMDNGNVEQEENNTYMLTPAKEYENFLLNRKKVVIHHSVDTGEYTTYSTTLNDGESYNLFDIVLALIVSHKLNDRTPTILEGIKYAYIDCGNDGIPELAVCIELSTEGIEHWNEYIVIKLIDQQLHVCYAGDEWSRSIHRINKYGYVVWEASGGAAQRCYKHSVIDADGKWNFLYSVDVLSDYAIETYIGNVETDINREDILLFILGFDSFVKEGDTCTYALTKDWDDVAGNKDINFYDLQVRYEDSYYSENPIFNAIKRSDLNADSMENIQNRVRTTYIKYGVTDVIVNDKDELNWATVDIPSELVPLQDNEPAYSLEGMTIEEILEECSYCLNNIPSLEQPFEEYQKTLKAQPAIVFDDQANGGVTYYFEEDYAYSVKDKDRVVKITVMRDFSNPEQSAEYNAWKRISANVEVMFSDEEKAVEVYDKLCDQLAPQNSEHKETKKDNDWYTYVVIWNPEHNASMNVPAVTYRGASGHYYVSAYKFHTVE